MAKFGDKASVIIRKAVSDGFFQCAGPADRHAAMRLNGRRMLDRDAKDADKFYPNDKTREHVAMLSQLDESQSEAVVETPSAEIVPIDGRDASGLVQVVQRARALLDSGDVINARMLAAAAYEQAKAAGKLAERFGAAERLIAKARQLQGDALLIETRAKIVIAREYDQAQGEGRAATKGRPKNGSEENILRHSDTGLSRKEIHEARKLAEAETRTPGLVERAIAARIAAGLEPNRANLRAAVGTSSATKEERGNNLYETPPEAVHTLLALETFTATVWEPACGRGAISGMLEAAHYGVVLSDLVDYNTCDQNGELQTVRDFLETEGDPDGSSSYDIVTNPPYGESLNAFVAHALRVHRPRKMALLLNVNFFGGTENADRNFAMDENRPARVYWFARRLPMMHRDGWEGNEASSRMNTAWFVWELQEDGSYGDTTVISRVDWEKFMPQAVSAESEAA